MTPQTISEVENEKRIPNEATRRVVRAAIDAAGIQLIDEIEGVMGAGACMKWGYEPPKKERKRGKTKSRKAGKIIDGIGQHSAVAVELQENMEIAEGDQNS